MNRNDQQFMAQKIRTQYMEKTPSELDALRELDAKVKRPANAFAYTFGSISAIIMGAGMSLVMTDIGTTIGIANSLPYGIIIGIIGMFMSTDMMYCYSLFSLYGSENMIYHSMLFIIASTMLVTGYYKPKKQHILRGYLVFLCIAIPTFVFDCIFKADYMYIYDCSLLGIFKPIADAMPHRLLWTLVAFTSYFIITVVFYFISLGISLLCNKNKKTEQIEEKEEALV